MEFLDTKSVLTIQIIFQRNSTILGVRNRTDYLQREESNIIIFPMGIVTNRPEPSPLLNTYVDLILNS